MIQARMLEGTTAEFEQELNELLAEGWDLGGPVHYRTVGDKVVCTQQLILELPDIGDMMTDALLEGLLGGMTAASQTSNPVLRPVSREDGGESFRRFMSDLTKFAGDPDDSKQ